MVRPILKLGMPALQRPAAAVVDFGVEIQRIVDDMIETMHAAPGIGLAASQIGVELRLFILDLSVGRNASDLQVLINPEIAERDGMQLEEEGCLSLPGFSATVLRPSRIVVRALDRDGSPKTVEGTGLLARALQHELDHLNGLLYVHRLRGLQRAVIQRRVRKLAHLGRW
jgi:peptide deformylase